MKIYSIINKEEDKFLRQKTKLFDFTKWTPKEIRQLIKEMRLTMEEAKGVGLAANQVGLNFQVFVALVDDKFYAVFNPVIVKTEGEMIPLEEGCLSVPQKYGRVPRYEKVILEGQSQSGRKIRIKGWGLLAHVFQHEYDHLQGTLFIDKAIQTYERPETERLRKKIS